MPQRITVANRKWFLSLAALCTVATTGCQRRPKSIAPEGLVPVSPDSVALWVQEFTPSSRVRLNLGWRYENDRGSYGGKAAARIAPPDSVRFDLRGMFGRSGSALVIGSDAIWSRPEGDFKDILQSAPLFWAALGAPIRPPEGAATFGSRTTERRAWRYVVGPDTFDFIDLRTRPKPQLLAEMRRRGQIVGLVSTQFDPSGVRLVSARVDFPLTESRFSISVEAVDSTERFPETWQRP